MKIRLTKAAIRDLGEVRTYIAADDPRAATRVVAKLEKSIALIGEQPHIGRPDPANSTREWSMPGLPYVIPYRVVGNVIEVIRIWHTSRDRPSEW